MDAKNIFKDEELSVVMHKSIEIYDTFKYVIIENNDKILTCNEKKKVALLFGISITDNDVGDILKMLNFEYNIKFFPVPKTDNEYNQIYLENFSFLDIYLGDNSTVEDLMLYLLEDSLIQQLFYSREIIVSKLVKVITNMIKSKKEKNRSLQKTKTVVL